jgi:hypothetical protein
VDQIVRELQSYVRRWTTPVLATVAFSAAINKKVRIPANVTDDSGES